MTTLSWSVWFFESQSGKSMSRTHGRKKTRNSRYSSAPRPKPRQNPMGPPVAPSITLVRAARIPIVRPWSPQKMAPYKRMIKMYTAAEMNE